MSKVMGCQANIGHFSLSFELPARLTPSAKKKKLTLCNRSHLVPKNHLFAHLLLVNVILRKLTTSNDVSYN